MGLPSPSCPGCIHKPHWESISRNFQVFKNIPNPQTNPALKSWHSGHFAFLRFWGLFHSLQHGLQSCNTNRGCSKCYKNDAGLVCLRFSNIFKTCKLWYLWLSIHLGVLNIPYRPPDNIPLSMCTLHTRHHQVRAYAESATPPEIAVVEFSLSKIRGVLMCTWPPVALTRMGVHEDGAS